MEEAKPNAPGEDEALKARLQTLSKALDERRQETEETARKADKASNASIGKAMGTGFRVASELAAAIMVGGFMGYMLDKWLGTSPWFLLVFLVLGIIAGFWNVYKLAAAPSQGHAPTKND